MNKSVLQAKKEAVKEIQKGFKDSQTIAVVSYQGLTVAELQELRRTLKESETTIGVYKNTLVARALEADGLEDSENLLSGPNAFVFSKDLSKGPKALVRFSRFHEKLVIKGGFVDGKAMNKDEIVAVSKIPDKNGLISMFLSCLQAPIRNLAYAISKVAEQSPAPAPAAEAPAATPAAAN